MAETGSIFISCSYLTCVQKSCNTLSLSAQAVLQVGVAERKRVNVCMLRRLGCHGLHVRAAAGGGGGLGRPCEQAQLQQSARLPPPQPITWDCRVTTRPAACE